MTATIDDWIDYGYQHGWITKARCLTHEQSDTLADNKKQQQVACIYTLELIPIAKDKTDDKPAV